VLYEEDHLLTNVGADEGWLSNYYELPDEDGDVDASTYPWVLRLELNAAALRDAGIQVYSIRRTLAQKLKAQLHIVYSDLPTTSVFQVIRIRCRRAMALHDSRHLLTRVLLHLVDLPLSWWREGEADCVKKVLVSINDEHKSSDGQASKYRIASIDDALLEFKLELQCLRHRLQGRVAPERVKAELASFQQRTAERLTTERDALSQYIHQLQDSACDCFLFTSRERAVANLSDVGDIMVLRGAYGETDVHERRLTRYSYLHSTAPCSPDGVELLVWARGVLRRWWDLPAEERERLYAATSHAKEQWGKKCLVAKLEKRMSDVMAFLAGLTACSI